MIPEVPADHRENFRRKFGRYFPADSDCAFLWYVYQRGGFFTSATYAHYTGTSQRWAQERVHALHDRGLIHTIYRENRIQTGHVKAVYRLQKKVLTAFGDPDSRIRKIIDIRAGLRALTLAHLFMEDDWREWEAIPRTARRAHLQSCGLQDADLPRYFVGRAGDEKSVVSINHEIILDPEKNGWIVYIPSGNMETKREIEKHLIEKWRAVFEKTGYGIIAVSYDTATSETIGRMEGIRQRKETRTETEAKPFTKEEQEAESKRKGKEILLRISAKARGERNANETRTERLWPTIRHVFYPDIMMQYGIP